MARGIAIRAITTLADQRVEIVFTAGDTPLPTGPSGSYVYPNLQMLEDEIRGLTSTIDQKELFLMHLAITWLQANGTFGNTNQVLNKTLVFDTTAAQPLKIV